MNPLFLIITCFGAGILSLCTPCTIPIMSGYASVVLHDGKRARRNALCFLGGLVGTFSIFGVFAGLIGHFLSELSPLISHGIGVIIILIGIGMIWRKKTTCSVIKPPSHSSSAFAAASYGSSIALAWTVCTGPILLGILAMASTLTSPLYGAALLGTYGLGMGLPIILCRSLHRWTRDSKATSSPIMGGILILIGLMIIISSIQ